MSHLFKIALSALILATGTVQAEEKPLWEVGVGVAALSFPSYRGSDQTNNFLMPVPMFSYHGDFFMADRHCSSAAGRDPDDAEVAETPTVTAAHCSIACEARKAPTAGTCPGKP